MEVVIEIMNEKDKTSAPKRCIPLNLMQAVDQHRKFLPKRPTA